MPHRIILSRILDAELTSSGWLAHGNRAGCGSRILDYARPRARAVEALIGCLLQEGIGLEGSHKPRSAVGHHHARQ